MTYKKAIELFETNWWEDVHPAEAVMRQLKCDRVIMPFELFHRHMKGFFPGLTDYDLANHRGRLYRDMSRRYGNFVSKVEAVS